MDSLKDLLRKFIEEQRSRVLNPGAQQNNNSEAETQLNDSGFDTNTIRDFINNAPIEESTDQILENIFKLIGKEVTFIKPIRVSDEGFVSKSITTKETEQGLEREVVKPLIVAACGKVIKEEEIGVRCSVPNCGLYDCKEHSFVCHNCGCGTCMQHTLFFKDEKGENIPLCPRCFQILSWNRYTW